MTIDGSQFAILIRPLVPDADAIRFQVSDIGVAREEPEEFMDDGFQMQLLRRHHRKAVRQIVARLPAESAERAGAGAVGLLDAVTAHMGHQVEILLHKFLPRGFGDILYRPRPRRTGSIVRARAFDMKTLETRQETLTIMCGNSGSALSSDRR